MIDNLNYKNNHITINDQKYSYFIPFKNSCCVVEMSKFNSYFRLIKTNSKYSKYI